MLSERRAALKTARATRQATRSKEQQQEHDNRHRRNLRILKDLNIGSSRQPPVGTAKQGASEVLLDTRHKYVFFLVVFKTFRLNLVSTEFSWNSL